MNLEKQKEIFNYIEFLYTVMSTQPSNAEDVLYRTIEVPNPPFKADISLTGVKVELAIIKSVVNKYEQGYAIRSVSGKNKIRSEIDVPVTFTETDINSLDLKHPVNTVEEVVWHYLHSKDAVKSLPQKIRYILFDIDKTTISDTNGTMYIPYNVGNSTYIVRPYFKGVYTLSIEDSSQSFKCINETTTYEHFELLPSESMSGELNETKTGFTFKKDSLLQLSDTIDLQICETEDFTMDTLRKMKNEEYMHTKDTDPHLYISNNKLHIPISTEHSKHKFSFDLTELGQLPTELKERTTEEALQGDIKNVSIKYRPAKTSDDEQFISNDDELTLVQICNTKNR